MHAHPCRHHQQRTLNLLGSVCMSLTRRHSPMRVARLQCCTVGVNCTLHGHRRPTSSVAIRGVHDGKARRQAGEHRGALDHILCI
jgi:hypothetical protein